MKIRALLTAAEIAPLQEWLGERLERIGVESQPELVAKILELTSNPNAQLQDYAKIIKTDPGLSGRLLKLSNSALFAQRRPVTSIDRACLLLGVERLKSISLGFHMSRAAAAGCKTGAKSIGREVWGPPKRTPRQFPRIMDGAGRRVQHHKRPARTGLPERACQNGPARTGLQERAGTGN